MHYLDDVFQPVFEAAMRIRIANPRPVYVNGWYEIPSDPVETGWTHQAVGRLDLGKLGVITLKGSSSAECSRCLVGNAVAWHIDRTKGDRPILCDRCFKTLRNAPVVISAWMPPGTVH